MKKSVMLLTSLLVVSLLASCNNNSKTITYHIKFFNGDDLIEEKDYRKNEKILAPSDPEPYEKDHKTYTFDAWYDEEFKYEVGLKADKDYTFIAKFNGKDIIYRIAFENGNKIEKEQTGIFNEKIIPPVDEPEKAPDKEYTYSFDAWYDKETGKKLEEDATIQGNQAFEAKFNKHLINYKASFIKGGIETPITFNAENLTITAPTFEPVSHYVCKWVSTNPDKSVNSGETINFTKDDLHDWTFNYQQDAIAYSITFLKSESVVSKITKKASDDDLSFTTPEFIATKHYTGEWNCNEWPGGAKSLGSKVKCSDLTVDILNNYEFIYKEEPTLYTLDFSKDGVDVTSITVSVKNKTFTTPDVEEITEHYDGCWSCTDSGFDDFLLPINEEYTLRDEEKYSELGNHHFEYKEIPTKYNIEYKLLGGKIEVGSNPTSYTIADDISLIAPTQEGYTFNGWYLEPDENSPIGGDGWNSGEMVGDITLYADWSKDDVELNKLSFSEIKEISNSDEVSKYFNVGDTKNIVVNGIQHPIRIIDFNKDELDTSTEETAQHAGITFEFATCIKKSDGNEFSIFWDDSDTSSGNFLISTLNISLQPNESSDGEVYTMIDNVTDGSGKLMDYIENVKKGVKIKEGEEWVSKTYSTKLFPLSYDETGGTGKGTYSYYRGNPQHGQSRRADKCAKGYLYWLRTNHTNREVIYAQYVSGYGDYGHTGVKSPGRVVPAFCF